MPALLLAGISDGTGKPVKSETGGPEMASMPVIILEGLAKKHEGRLVPSAGGFCLMAFDKAPSAVACALAAQARFADYNRGKPDEKQACVRLTVHASNGSAGGPVPDKDAKLLSLMQEVTPPGRIFVTRPVFTHSHGAQACAFINLGIEYFSGLPEPLDLLEAIPVVGATRTLSPAFSSRATQLPVSMAAAGTLPPAPAPSLPMFEAFNDPMTMAVAAAAGLVLSLAGDLALTVFSPFDLVDYPFHFAGHLLFGLMGDEGSAMIGALALQALAPAAVLVHFWLRDRPVMGQAALFWLGQSLLSIGGHWAAPGSPDMNTFGGCIKNDGMTLAASLGILKHYNAWAHATSFVGCMLIATALAGLWVHLKGREPEAAKA